MTQPTQLSVQADLDVPGDTGLYMRIFSVWALCLVITVILANRFRARVPVAQRGTSAQRKWRRTPTSTTRSSRKRALFWASDSMNPNRLHPSGIKLT